MKILKHFNDIEKNIRRNNTVVRGLILLMIVMVIFFSIALVRISIYYSDNRIILETDGQARKVDKRVSDREALKIECQHHIAMFYGTFYTLNQFDFDKQIEASYWLGDESIRAVYKKYKSLGWYDKIIQDNIEMSAEITHADVDLTKYPYPVTVQGILIFRKGFNEEKFQLNGTCLLEKTSRKFPENPHGLFILNWTPSLLDFKK
jgi:hypothetical protein